MRIVLANGCFDILHRGHVEHLHEASLMGDKLIVSLTNDQFVNKGPGRPINTWIDRAKVLDALRCVYMVVPTNNAMDAIRLIKPAIFVKGIDYSSGGNWTEEVEKACQEVGAQLKFTYSSKQSATDIIRRVHELSGHG